MQNYRREQELRSAAVKLMVATAQSGVMTLDDNRTSNGMQTLRVLQKRDDDCNDENVHLNLPQVSKHGRR